MFGKSTRKIIQEQKWSKHSNPPLLFSRIKRISHLGLSDLALAAKKLPEEQLDEIFTKENLQPLIMAIMHPSSTKYGKKFSKEERDRIFELGYMLIDSSIDITGHSLGNIYAERLYSLHKKNFMDLLHVIHNDRLIHKL